MRKLKLALYVSLDGVVEEPAWTAPFWNDELAAIQAEYLYSSEALVLGRVTYQGFAAAWPAMEEATGEFGRKMNTMPKFVASTTVRSPSGTPRSSRATWSTGSGRSRIAPAPTS